MSAPSAECPDPAHHELMCPTCAQQSMLDGFRSGSPPPGSVVVCPACGTRIDPADPTVRATE